MWKCNFFDIVPDHLFIVHECTYITNSGSNQSTYVFPDCETYNQFADIQSYVHAQLSPDIRSYGGADT